jgi:hypothetical protein
VSRLPNAERISGAASDDTEAGPKFILICVLAGPAIGFVATAFLSSGRLVAPATVLLDLQNWIFAYMVGFPFAFSSAVLFLLFSNKLKWPGIVSAIAGALVPVAAFSVYALSEDYSRGHGLRWSSISGSPIVALDCLLAMISCWLMARLFRIVK